MSAEKVKGFFNSLTPKQQEAALAYEGPENFGFPTAPAAMPGERERFVGLMTGPDPAKVWKAQAYKMADTADAAEARALAAEAALAAERERCALIAANETIHPLGEQIAAAIRAQGE